MDRRQARDAIQKTLVASGFSLAYASTAVSHYVHPDRADVFIRIGTTHIVAEQRGTSVYRAQLAEFDLETMLARLGVLDGSEEALQMDADEA